MLPKAAVRTWSSGQGWLDLSDMSSICCCQGRRRWRTQGCPWNSQAGWGEPVGPRDPKLTSLPEKHPASRLSSGLSGFPAPPGPGAHSEKTQWPSPPSAGLPATITPMPFPPGLPHYRRGDGMCGPAQNTCLCVFNCTRHHSHKTGAGDPNAHIGQAACIRAARGHA